MLRHHILAESSFVSLVRRGNVLPCCLSLLYARIMVESLRCSTPNPAISCCRVDVLSGMVCILLVVLWLQCFKRSPVINLVSASASAKQPLRFRLTRRPHSCMQSSHLPSLRLRLFWREHGRAPAQQRCRHESAFRYLVLWRLELCSTLVF